MSKIKLCECGCGKPTRVITHTMNRLGRIKGEYSRFIQGHHLKILKKSKKHKKRIGLGNFKGGRVSRGGYIYIYVKDHPYANKFGVTRYVLEHRLVMEKHLGRYLKPKEVIHHIDGNKGNNILSNLILFKNQSDHVKFHSLLEIIYRINKMKGGMSKKMGKIIVKNVVDRQPGYLYYIDGKGNVCEAKMNRNGKKKSKKKTTKKTTKKTSKKK